MKIALITNKPERERCYMDLIAKRMIQMDSKYETLIVNYQDSNWWITTLTFAPDIILTFPLTSSGISHFYNLIKLIVKCRIICLRTEGAINYQSQEQIRWQVGLDEYSENLVDHEFFWGKRPAEVIGKELIKSKKIKSNDRIHVVGHPGFEYLFHKREEKIKLPGTLATKLDRINKKYSFLFITGFHLADYSDDDLLRAGDLVRVNHPDSESDMLIAKRGVEKAQIMRDTWIHMINDIARKFPHCSFFLKPHPIEKEIFSNNIVNPYLELTKAPNIIYVDEKCKVGDLLDHVNTIFHYGSTCSAEAYIKNVPSVYLYVPDLYDDNENPNAFTYSTLGWPSTLELAVTEVAAFITSRLNQDTSDELGGSSKMLSILASDFDISAGNLAGEDEYCPSKTIARKLIKSLTLPALTISDDHRFITSSVQRLGLQCINSLIAKINQELRESSFLGSLQGCNLLLFLFARFPLDNPIGVKVEELRLKLITDLFAKSDPRLHSDAHIYSQITVFLQSYIGNCESLVPLVSLLIENGFIDEALNLITEINKRQPNACEQFQRSLFLTHATSFELCSTLSPGLSNELTQLKQSFDRMTPRIFMLETVLACNLYCPECAIGGDMIDRTRTIIKLDQFVQIFEKIKSYCQYLYLHIWGEPTMNKDLVSMIKYASRFCRTNVSTNGLLLDFDSAENLITSGVSDLIVSIDGVTQGVYEKYRVGGVAKIALKALEDLQNLNNKHGNNVNIIPQFIVFKHNEHEMDLFSDFCKGIGLRPSFKAPYIREPSDFSHSNDKRFHRPHYDSLSSRLRAMRGCNDPREVLTILVDGTCVACCHDSNRVTNFGNIFSQSVPEIWGSEAYRRFRWDVLSGNAPSSCLTTCLSYASGSTERSFSERPISFAASRAVQRARKLTT